MAVAPKHQYRGIGTQLVSRITEFADEIGAEVRILHVT